MFFFPYRPSHRANPLGVFRRQEALPPARRTARPWIYGEGYAECWRSPTHPSGLPTAIFYMWSEPSLLDECIV